MKSENEAPIIAIHHVSAIVHRLFIILHISYTFRYTVLLDGLQYTAVDISDIETVKRGAVDISPLRLCYLMTMDCTVSCS